MLNLLPPTRSNTFSINPVKDGNGVKPIKQAFVQCLGLRYGWGLEVPLAISSNEADAGPIDAVKLIPETGRRFAVEWETGNRSEERRVGKEGRSRWSPY